MNSEADSASLTTPEGADKYAALSHNAAEAPVLQLPGADRYQPTRSSSSDTSWNLFVTLDEPVSHRSLTEGASSLEQGRDHESSHCTKLLKLPTGHQ